MRFTLKDKGLIFDGVRGIHIGRNIQQLAIDNNWNEKPILDPEHEEYWDATDSAIEYLNTLCEENVMFTMYEGDFVLEQIAE